MKLANTKERILQYIDFKSIRIKEFYLKTGIKRGFLDSDKLDSAVSDAFLTTIIACYPDLSLNWLLTGKGDMLNPEEEKTDHSNLFVAAEPKEEYKKLVETGIPLIPVAAFAGVSSGDVSILELDCERFVIPTFRDADFLIPIKGSSMEPKYSSGDLVACKWLPLDTFIQWNKVYVLDTIQGPLIKRICQGSSDSTLKIVSENEKYPPYELNKSEIRKLAIVIGVIRLE